MKDTVVILANSIKHRLRCVAGKSLTTGRWVRLVSDVDGEAITKEQAKITNKFGSFLCKPLQRVVMQLNTPVPLRHQPENYLCEPNWIQDFKIEIGDLPKFIDHPENLWGEGNRISATMILSNEVQIGQSLYLVQVTNVQLYLTDDEKRRVSFNYEDIAYDLPCTCTDFDKMISGEMNHNNFIVVSLGENHEGYHYKIVATIL